MTRATRHCGALSNLHYTARPGAPARYSQGCTTILSIDRIDSCPLRCATDQHETMCRDFSPERGRRIRPWFSHINRNCQILSDRLACFASLSIACRVFLVDSESTGIQDVIGCVLTFAHTAYLAEEVRRLWAMRQGKETAGQRHR